ncbi:MAG: serine/threonine protein phosphatase [Rickettsiales bacterium]|jgi:hypothetical protein|nr:serine/threonine protein phosphatase [Rickettsiales bacterium]
MKSLTERKAEYQKVAKEIARMKQAGEFLAALDSAEEVHSGIGGTAVRLVIAGVPIFAKRLVVTDIDMASMGSTKNLFNLPTFYQYGVNSTGFGAWRELAASQMATDWVLNDECPHFPLMYGSVLLPKAKKAPMTPPEQVQLDNLIRYWEDSPEIRNRLESLHNASHEVVIFLESIPITMDALLHPDPLKAEAIRPNMVMVEQDIDRITAFIASKGMMHFDGDGGNILTDGERLYLADFGLATSLEFELDDVEREFLDRNQGLDRALSLSSLTWHKQDQLPLMPEVQATSERYKGVAAIMDLFISDLRTKDTKQAIFPSEAILASLREVDTIKEQGVVGTSFVANLGAASQDGPISNQNLCKFDSRQDQELSGGI